MKHIYSSDGKYIISTYDEISDEEILNVYENSIITNIEYIAPVLKNGELVETYNKKITVVYDENKEILEIRNGHFNLENSKVFNFDANILENQKYYTLNEHLELVFNEELKNQDLEKEKQEKIETKRKELKTIANTLKQKLWEYGFIFKDNLRQPCREQDKTAVIGAIVGFSAMGISKLKWKFFEKDTDQHIYLDLDIDNLKYLALMIKGLTDIGMVSESTIINELDSINDLEEIENYNVKEKFEELVKLGKAKAMEELKKIV